MFSKYARNLFEHLVANNFEHIRGLGGNEISPQTPIIGLVNLTGSMWHAVMIVNTNIIDANIYEQTTKDRLDEYFEELLKQYGKKSMVVLNLFVSEGASNYAELLAKDNFEFDRPVINVNWGIDLRDESLAIGKNNPDEIANLKELVMDSLEALHVLDVEDDEADNTIEKVYESAILRRPKLEERGGPTPIVTYILIIINMLIGAIVSFDGNRGFDTAMWAGALIPNLVIGGQYYRLLSSMFLHVNFMHLINNCFSLYIFGLRVEKFYGAAKFIAIFILSGIFAGIVSVIFVPNPTIGASGGVFGLIGAVLALAFKSKADVVGLNYTTMIIMAGISLSLGFTRPEVNNHAHVGGLVAGVILGFLLFRPRKKVESLED